MLASPCNQTGPPGNKQANQLSLIMAGKENVIEIIAVFSRGPALASALILCAVASPAGDNATFRLQGAIQHNQSWLVSARHYQTVSDNKGQNRARGLETARLCSSARISVPCAVIMYCAKTFHQPLPCVHWM